MFYYLIAANFIMVAVFALRFQTMPPQIPLFYSKMWGEDQLADTWMIVLLPLLLNGLFFFNNYIAGKYFKDNIFVNKVIYYTNLFLIISITGIFLKIILLIS